LIATAHGSQAAASTLATLHTIVHALRGWPTPLGAAINTSGGVFVEGRCEDEHARWQLEEVGRQTVGFVHAHRAAAAP
jgi:FMN reductase